MGEDYILATHTQRPAAQLVATMSHFLHNGMLMGLSGSSSPSQVTMMGGFSVTGSSLERFDAISLLLSVFAELGDPRVYARLQAHALG